MKLKYIAYSALLALAPVASSCDDFLSKLPDNRVELNTPDQLQMLLVNGYMQYNVGVMNEISSDNIIDNNSPDPASGMRYNLAPFERMDNEIFAWEPAESSLQQDSPSSLWQGCYHAIAVANAVLDRIPYFESIGQGEEVAPYKGEALLIRAYHHFLLANLFCQPYRGPELSKQLQGIPYMTEPETTLTTVYDRGNLADVYDNIEKDLLEGLPLIDDAIYEQPKYHFNTAAANAFAARFYLFKRDYENVVKYANLAFGGEAGPAQSALNDVWQHSFADPDQITQYYISVERQSNFLLLPTVSTAARLVGTRYAWNREGVNATINGQGPTWQDFNFHPCYDGKIYIVGGEQYGLFFPGTCGELFEYTDKIAGIGYTHIVRPEFTAEETLLCRAEAKIFLGDIDGGVADLRIWDENRQNNTHPEYDMPDLTRELIESFYSNPPAEGMVKPLHIDEVCPSDKYSVTPANELYLQCVLHYRRIETFHTGMRWFDIRRFGIEIEHYIGANGHDILKWDDPRRAYQLPADVLTSGMEPTIRDYVSTPSNQEYVKSAVSCVKIK